MIDDDALVDPEPGPGRRSTTITESVWLPPGAGVGGEVQLTDAMQRLMQDQAFHAFKYAGQDYDCGDKLLYLASGADSKDALTSTVMYDPSMNTWVKVTNLVNGKSVIVRINDRMHPRMAKKGRVVDLSRVAAEKLDFIKKGLVKVKVQVVDFETVD